MEDNEHRGPRTPEEEHTRKYAAAIGRGLSSHSLAVIKDYLQDARPADDYGDHPDENFIYEILCKDGWRDKVKALADAWIQDYTNVHRAAEQVGRQNEARERKLLRGFCAFRLKEFKGDGWKTPLDFLGIDDHEPQTVVFIALQDLDSTNGFFMKLQEGSDVCLDSRASIQFPGTGGGLGVFLALNL